MFRFPPIASLAAGLAALAAASGPAPAEPRSAIPWLSDALIVRPPSEARPRAVPGPRPIEVSVLGAPRPLGAGLLDAAAAGLAPGLWGESSALRLRLLIGRVRGTGVPAAQEMLRTLMLARLTEPRGAGTAFLLARADMLLRMGAVEEARELLASADDRAPEVLARLFDTGLLVGDQAAACRALGDAAGAEPRPLARIFCLARDGDWRGAAGALSAAEAAGGLNAAEAELARRFLGLVETRPGEAIALPDPLTPLAHVMLLSIGAGPAALADLAPLPPAFYHHDLSPQAPPRARILAAERLVAAGGLGWPVLFAAYRMAKPAASGGVWSRAAAVQALDRALDQGAPAAIAAALDAADAALSPLGLRVALAQEYHARLVALPPDPALRDSPLAELVVLGGDSPLADRLVAPDDTLTLRAALAAARGKPFPRGDARINAIAQAFSDGPAGGGHAAGLMRLIETGRPGEALIRALADLDAGTRVDPVALAAALSVLRRLGQESAARRIAVETLLAERRG